MRAGHALSGLLWGLRGLVIEGLDRLAVRCFVPYSSWWLRSLLLSPKPFIKTSLDASVKLLSYWSHRMHDLSPSYFKVLSLYSHRLHDPSPT